MTDADRFREWFSSSSERPLFLIVCDHGVRGDHADCDHTSGCKEVDPVAVMPWFPNSGRWWTAEGVDTSTVITRSMHGNFLGSDPWDILGESEPAGGDPNREHIEIMCPETRCSERKFRADGRKFVALLTALADDERLRSVFAVYADASRIVVTLANLDAARTAAKRYLDLDV